MKCRRILRLTLPSIIKPGRGNVCIAEPFLYLGDATLRSRRVFTILAAMMKLKVFTAESVSPEDFYDRDWEGHIVEEIVRLLGGKASYRIVLNDELLCRAIKTASDNDYDVFHLSCHGSDTMSCVDRMPRAQNIEKQIKDLNLPIPHQVATRLGGADQAVQFSGFRGLCQVYFYSAAVV
jgi:hypothetical protein